MKKALVWICIALSLCGLLTYSDHIEREVTAWRTQRGMGEARRRLADLKKHVPIDDRLLVDLGPDLRIPKSNPECIVGTGALIFGSELRYEEVKNQYTERFQDMRWVFLGEDTSGQRINFRDISDTISISIYPDSENEFQQWLTLAEVPKTTVTEWTGQYRTLYGISITYGEPEIPNCFF